MYFQVPGDFYPTISLLYKTKKVAANENLLSTCNTLDFVFKTSKYPYILTYNFYRIYSGYANENETAKFFSCFVNKIGHLLGMMALWLTSTKRIFYVIYLSIFSHIINVHVHVLDY
jgi:hypothetical protein